MSARPSSQLMIACGRIHRTTVRLREELVSAMSFEQQTMRQISLRLLPILFLLYLFNFIDRSNVSLAALQMNHDLGFGAAAYGFGAGVFFLGYALLEIPSNLLMLRVGARRWLARIGMTWGLIACSMVWIRTPTQFYVVRFALGVAEAGLIPGVMFYLSGWFPEYYPRAWRLSEILCSEPVD